MSLEQELVRHSVEVCNKLRVNLRAFIWKLWSNSMHCGNEGKNDEHVPERVVVVTAARPNERRGRVGAYDRCERNENSHQN